MDNDTNTVTDGSPKEPSGYFLGISILIAGVLITGAVIYSVGYKSGNPNAANLGGLNQPSANQGQSATSSPSINGDDVVLGDPKAPVTIFEFGDYQCPFCSRFWLQTEPQIRDNYVKTGKVKMVYRDFAFLGPESQAAANAVRCAADQGKYWEYHDALFSAEVKDGQENNGNLNTALFTKIAGDLKLNADDFKSCLDSGKYTKLVIQWTGDASKYGVNSTPYFFVNGAPLVGAQPYAQFEAVIQAALASQ